MKRVETLYFLSEIYKFSTILDENGTEYVVFESSSGDYVRNIQDKTAFESFENHRHILDNIKKIEFFSFFPIAEGIGQSLLYSLKQVFPNKRFVVYVTLRVGDAMIVRFHQIWDGVPWYYNPADFTDPDEKVFAFTD